MRLQFFIPSLTGGGAERVLSLISDELVNRGHDVCIVISDNDVAYKLNSRIELFCIKDVRLPVRGRFLEKQLCRARNFIRYKKQVGVLIKAFRPDVIITFMESQIFPILLFHKDIPVVSSEHNTMNRRFGYAIHFQRFVFNRFCDRITVLTVYDQQYAIRKGLKQTVVINNPLTYKPINKAEYEQLFQNRNNIFACGRINSWVIKGFDLLIKSFAEIAKDRPDVDLDIAGGGNEEDFIRLQDIAKECGVGNRVHFLGFRNDIDELMKTHSVFVLSSRTEGFGMVLIEAMSQGLPCVSFALPGPNEIIKDGVDGVLVPEQDCLLLSKQVLELVSNSELRYKMGLNAIENVDDYSIAKITDKWECLFNELIRKEE